MKAKQEVGLLQRESGVLVTSDDEKTELCNSYFVSAFFWIGNSYAIKGLRKQQLRIDHKTSKK